MPNPLLLLCSRGGWRCKQQGALFLLSGSVWVSPAPRPPQQEGTCEVPPGGWVTAGGSLLRSAVLLTRAEHEVDGFGMSQRLWGGCSAVTWLGTVVWPLVAEQQAHGRMKETPRAPSDARHKELVPPAHLSANSSASLVLSPPGGHAPGCVHRQPHPDVWAPSRLPVSTPVGTSGTSLPAFLFQPPPSQPHVDAVVGR